MVWAHGADGGMYPMWDGLAKLYVSIDIIWTTLLFCAIGFLILNRNVHCVRIRNLPLSVAAAVSLHCYGALLLTGYTMNGLAPCDAEYWIMSIYLPLGIALYQASNMQLLSVATAQERLVRKESMSLGGQLCRLWPHRLWRNWRQRTLLSRTMLIMYVAFGIQCVISLALYLGSRKFHAWGSFSEPVSPVECRRGPEWIPSIFMQMTWAWIFAPCLLWKIRRINDVHHWRLQTTICVIAGMPSSPLWLAALYSSPTSVWAKINPYFPPPFWFIVPIMAMEVSSIFLPCFEVIQSARHQKYVAAAIEDWEIRRQGGEGKSVHTTSSFSSRLAQSLASSNDSKRSELYSRGSFQKHLDEDTTGSLLEFAARREFSGENVVFLNCTRDWIQAWERLGGGEEHRRHFFKIAIEIYADYVDLKSAEFPINIESHIYRRLSKIFGPAARKLDRIERQENSVTPFDFAEPPEHGTPKIVSVPTSSNSQTTKSNLFNEKPCTPGSLANAHRNIMTVDSRLPADIEIPAGFRPDVWNTAIESIKVMVFTNTWPKYVDMVVEEASQSSDETADSMERGGWRRGMCF